MSLSRVGALFVVLAIFCGPFCSVQIGKASAVKQDCHSKPVEKKSQPGIHSCCHQALLPSSEILPERTYASLDWMVFEPQVFMRTEFSHGPAFLQEASSDHRSEWTILRI